MFYTVYRPDRLARLLTALSAAGLEPKRLRPVAADAGRAPLVLVESVRGAAEGMVYEKNLVLFTATRRIRSIRRNWRGFIIFFS